MTRLVVVVLAVGGFVSLLFGLWLMWEPLAWTVGGVLAMAVSFLLEDGEESQHDPEPPR